MNKLFSYRGVARIFQRGGHTVSNIIVMAFSPRNIVACLLKKGFSTKGGVTGTPAEDPPHATPFIYYLRDWMFRLEMPLCRGFTRQLENLTKQHLMLAVVPGEDQAWSCLFPFWTEDVIRTGICETNWIVLTNTSKRFWAVSVTLQNENQECFMRSSFRSLVCQIVRGILLHRCFTVWPCISVTG